MMNTTNTAVTAATFRATSIDGCTTTYSVARPGAIDDVSMALATALGLYGTVKATTQGLGSGRWTVRVDGKAIGTVTFHAAV